jgi:methionine biosynthesis protein MetW
MAMDKVDRGDLRYDLKVVAAWIHPGARVLGLGCGEGDLLYYLKTKKDVACTGIEIDESRAARCIERGLSVLQGDINEEVQDYPNDSFDYVILSQTLQQIYAPAELIKSMLRIGKRAVVSFPNFSHWKIRGQLLLKGIAPVSRELPYQWHNTPNIRVITIKDFQRYAGEVGFKIFKEVAINTNYHDRSGHVITLFPNLRACYGIFLIGKEST